MLCFGIRRTPWSSLGCTCGHGIIENWNITRGTGFIQVGHQTGQDFQGPVHNLFCVEKFINLTEPAMAKICYSLLFLRRRAIFRTENGIVVTLIIEQFVITVQEQRLTAIWNFMNKMTH